MQGKHVIFFSPYLSHSVEITGIIEALYVDLEDLQTLKCGTKIMEMRK